MTRLGWGALAVLAGAAACVVPSLDSLGPGACDSTHPCVDGYACVSGFCQRSGVDGGCVEGAACGSNVGQCQAGIQHCNPDGTLATCAGAIGPTLELCNGLDDDCDGVIDNGPDGGALFDLAHPCALTLGVCAGSHPLCIDGGFESACTALSYGPSYQLTETRCDGLDNDCNGTVDRLADGGALQSNQACELQFGVCTGAARACVDGGFETPCGSASYGPNYQVFESRCDGLDNDCDGLTDSWNRIQVSPPGVAAVNPVAVANPGVPFGVIFVWEQNGGVVSRTFNPDGTLGVVRQPSSSLSSSIGSRGARLATDGQTVAAAWAELLAGGSTRVVTTTLDSTGVSTLDGGGAAVVQPIVTPGELDVAVGGGNVYLALQGAFDGGDIEITWMSMPVGATPPAQDFLVGGAGLGGAPGKAPKVGYGNMTGIEVVAVWWNEPSTGSVRGEAVNVMMPSLRQTIGPLTNAAAPALFPPGTFWSSADGGSYVQALTCSGLSCTTLTSFGPLPNPPVVELSGLDPGSAFVWEDTGGGGMADQVWLFNVAKMATAKLGLGTHHPTLVAPGPGPKNVIVVFGQGAQASGIVFAQPFCLQ